MGDARVDPADGAARGHGRDAGILAPWCCARIAPDVLGGDG